MNKLEWIGATVHEIDDGIDTGKVLAYAPVQLLFSGEGFPSLFVRSTETGVGQLINTLKRLESGERWEVPALPGPQEYRSTISGLKLLYLKIKGWLLRIA